MNPLRSIDIDKMTNQVVETFLPKGTKDKVMIFDIRIDVSCYEGDEDVSIYKNIQIGFYAPNNYIQVGYRKSDEGPFTHTANHDSGWREGAKRGLDVIIEEIQNEIKEKGIQDKDLYPFVHFGMRGIKVLENTRWRFEETNGHYEGLYHLEKLD